MARSAAAASATTVLLCLLGAIQSLGTQALPTTAAAAPAGRAAVASTRPQLGLLERRWDWKEASEESRTEWSIVLKRYVLVDMTLFELGRHFEEALPASPAGASGTSTTVDEDALATARLKVERLQSNLEKAVLDQNTSDATAGDMQKDGRTNFLTRREKRILAEEHKREQFGFFAVEASGQDVLQQAVGLLQALEAAAKRPQPSWGSIVAAADAPAKTKSGYPSLLPTAGQNAARAAVKAAGLPPHNATQAKPRSAATTVRDLFGRFQEASQTFHKDMANFQALQSKAVTNLLTLSARPSGAAPRLRRSK